MTYYVGVDMDGVLYPFDKAFNRLSKKYGGPQHDFKAWVNFAETFGDKVVEKVWHDPSLFQIEDPYPRCIQALKDIHSMKNVKVLIITNPGRNPEISVPAKWAWLQKHAPFVHHYEFITMHPKWLMHLDLLVEDNHDNAKACLKKGYVERVGLVSRPWNEKYHKKLIDKGAYVAKGLEFVPPLVSLFKKIKE